MCLGQAGFVFIFHFINYLSRNTQAWKAKLAACQRRTELWKAAKRLGATRKWLNDSASLMDYLKNFHSGILDNDFSVNNDVEVLIIIIIN